MKKSVSFIFAAAFALGVILPIRAAAQDAGTGNRASAVFVMSNSAEKNEVIAFSRTAEGTLEETLPPAAEVAAAIPILWNRKVRSR